MGRQTRVGYYLCLFRQLTCVDIGTEETKVGLKCKIAFSYRNLENQQLFDIGKLKY